MFVFVCLLGCSFVLFLSHFEVHHGGHAAGKGPAYSANHSLLTLRCAVLQAALPTSTRVPEPATPQVLWSGSPPARTSCTLLLNQPSAPARWHAQLLALGLSHAHHNGRALSVMKELKARLPPLPPTPAAARRRRRPPRRPPRPPPPASPSQRAVSRTFSRSQTARTAAMSSAGGPPATAGTTMPVNGARGGAGGGGSGGGAGEDLGRWVLGVALPKSG